MSSPIRRYGGLVFLSSAPAAVALEFLAPERHTALFFLSILAIVPLAGYIGRATDELAEHFGGAIGGLLNATFGNIAEVIIGALALRAGFTDLVKASLTGSIIGNTLLVFGLAAFVGGLKHRVQHFNRTAASLNSTMLLLSVVALVVPAVFHSLSRHNEGPELRMDTEIAVVLLLTYCASLVFTLKTHKEPHVASHASSSQHRTSVSRSVTVLLGATAGVAWMSELLVGALSATTQALGMSELFVGVVVVAVIGNAAEHYSAVHMAAKGQMDAALSIAVGSSIQIALMVTPLLLFLSYAIAPKPMNLLFTEFEVVAVGLAVLTIAMIAHDGETHWMEGVQMLAVYAILVLGFYFLPPGK
ncbi:MAG TPA: calcium/proton exchanger [Vicinamibacterales bacterium]|nr:calcium/proton exchanger [Vicinamibacterales bacterium]